jgi:hypothetical protein
MSNETISNTQDHSKHKGVASKDSFDIKFISDNLEMLKDIKIKDISKLAEYLTELPKNSALDDKYKVEKGKILTYILTTKSWFDKNKQLPTSKDWKLVLKAIYNGSIDNENKDFPVWNGEFNITEHRGWEDYWLKDVLDLNSPIVDIFADLWVAAYCTIPSMSFKLSIYAPMIYNSFPINRKIVEKAINVRVTHSAMQKHYKYIEKMGLVDEYENVVFPVEVIENTNPQTEDEKVEFMISMLSLDYWDNDSAYEVTGEVDTFYKLVEECKSNKGLAEEVSSELFSLFVFDNFPGKSNLNSSKIDLLSDLHTSLDFGKKGASGRLRLCSHGFIGLYDDYRELDPLALACWEKLIDRPEAYCEFKDIQGDLEEHAPHLYKKFALLTPPKPEYYEEFWESGKLKESGTRTCESVTNRKEYYENGQIKYDHDARLWWYEGGQIKFDNGEHYYENGQIKSETEFTDSENYSEVGYFEDGTIKLKRNVVKNISTATMYLKTGKKILQSSTDNNIKKHVGEYTHWHKNGEVWDAITYNSEGVPEGKRLTYNEQGNIIFTADYNNGEICNQSGIEQKISYGVAQLSIIPPIEKTTTWVNGVKHGAETTYTYDDDFSAERVLVETSICEYKDGVVVNEKVEE